jgi:hypothetical protein
VQLQNDFKNVKRRKKNPPETPKAKKTRGIVVPDTKAVEEASETLNRRGRQIRLPQRFRE